MVELLITASILGIVALAIFSAFAGGLKVYTRLEAYSGIQTDILVALEQMERDLRNSLAFSQIPFSGGSRKLSFASVVEELDDEGNIDVSIGRVTYYYDTLRGALLKKEENYRQALSQSTWDYAGIRRVARVDGIRFRYFCYNTETEAFRWRNSLAPESELDDEEEEEEFILAAVRIEAAYRGAGGRVTLSRTVFFPTAVSLVRNEVIANIGKGDEDG